MGASNPCTTEPQPVSLHLSDRCRKRQHFDVDLAAAHSCLRSILAIDFLANPRIGCEDFQGKEGDQYGSEGKLAQH